MSEWIEYKLGECVTVLNGYAFKSSDFKNTQLKDFLPVIKIKNVANGDVTLNDVQYHHYSEEYNNYVLSKGDILIALTGNHSEAKTQVVGGVSLYKLNKKALLNQRVAKIIPHTNIVNEKYLYYLMKEDNFHMNIASKASGSASQANISKKDIEEMVILLPSLTKQDEIASILCSLDDKIDLLNRENATLEAMAETLFRQWFIEEAKEDWKEGKLGDILSVKGGTTPSTKESRYWDGDIAWTSPRDITTLNGIYLFKTEKTITEVGLKQISSGLLPKGTLLMSSRAPVGVLAFAEIPLAINQGYIAILDDKGYAKEFIYLWLKTNMDLVHSYSNGSTFMEISKSAFKSLDITIPSQKEVSDFVTMIKPYFDKIKLNEEQIRLITKQRDVLLPKLMSNTNI